MPTDAVGDVAGIEIASGMGGTTGTAMLFPPAGDVNRLTGCGLWRLDMVIFALKPHSMPRLWLKLLVASTRRASIKTCGVGAVQFAQQVLHLDQTCRGFSDDELVGPVVHNDAGIRPAQAS